MTSHIQPRTVPDISEMNKGIEWPSMSAILTNLQPEASFEQEGAELLEQSFPKNDCNERGDAMVLFAHLVMLHKRLVSKAIQEERKRIEEAVVKSIERYDALVESGKFEEDDIDYKGFGAEVLSLIHPQE